MTTRTRSEIVAEIEKLGIVSIIRLQDPATLRSRRRCAHRGRRPRPRSDHDRAGSHRADWEAGADVVGGLSPRRGNRSRCRHRSSSRRCRSAVHRQPRVPAGSDRGGPRGRHSCDARLLHADRDSVGVGRRGGCGESVSGDIGRTRLPEGCEGAASAGEADADRRRVDRQRRRLAPRGRRRRRRRIGARRLEGDRRRTVRRHRGQRAPHRRERSRRTGGPL